MKLLSLCTTVIGFGRTDGTIVDGNNIDWVLFLVGVGLANVSSESVGIGGAEFGVFR